MFGFASKNRIFMSLMVDTNIMSTRWRVTKGWKCHLVNVGNHNVIFNQLTFA